MTLMLGWHFFCREEGHFSEDGLESMLHQDLEKTALYGLEMELMGFHTWFYFTTRSVDACHKQRYSSTSPMHKQPKPIAAVLVHGELLEHMGTGMKQ